MKLYSKVEFLSCRVNRVFFEPVGSESWENGPAQHKTVHLVLTSRPKSSAQTGKGKSTLSFLFAFCVPILPLLSRVNVGASFSLWPSDLAVMFLKYFFLLLYTLVLKAVRLSACLSSFRAYPTIKPFLTVGF